MYKQSQLKKCLSVLLSIVVGVSSFGLTGFAQSPERPDTVYHGKLICDLDEHSHSKKCCREASTSDAKKEETFCGLKEHVHSADCYEAGEPVTEDPKAEESKKEDSKTETPEINPSEPEAEQPESAEETLEVESARIASYDYGQVGFWTPGRYPDAEFHVTTFEELMAAVNDANEKDKYYWITLENDIEWNDVVTISNSAILFNINGHTVDITTKSAMLVKQKMDVCIKGPGTINVKQKLWKRAAG